MKIIFIALFFLLILLSLFPRSIEIFNQNPVFGFDQGRDYLAVKSIVIDHKLTLIGAELGAGFAGIKGIFQGPFYYYLLTIPFILFNGNPAGANYLMLILGLLAISAGFILGKKLFGKLGGMLTAFLLSVSPILIGQSRFIWNPHCPPLFIILSFIFIYLFIIEKKKLYIFLAAFFTGFIYNFEFAVSFPMSLALSIFSVYLFRGKIKYYLYLLLGFLVAFAPTFLFEIRHNLMGIKGFISYLGKENPLSNIPFSNFILDHTKSFIYSVSESFPINNFYFSLCIFLAIVFLSLYFVKNEKNANLKKFISYLLFLIPINYFVFFFLKNSLWTYYLTDLTIVYLILLTYICYSVCIKRYYRSSLIILIFIALLILIGLFNSISNSLHDYSDYGGTAKLKGKIAAIDYVYSQAKGKPFGLLIFSPPIYIYPYDYLIWWYGQKKYDYVPYKEKRGNVYLLIEKDNDQPWTHKGWLETVIKTGTIIKTTILPSGFIVQERHF